MEKIYWAAKYIRTSTVDDKQEHRNSCENQSKLIDNFLRCYPEIKIVSQKIDNGFSGLFFHRPAFNELISEIKSGHIDCVIVKDLSRIGRNYIEVGRYLRDFFPTYHIRFISVEDNIDSIRLDGFDRTIALIKNIFSEQYSRDVSLKTRSALDAKRKKGEYVGAIPIYGYQKSSETKNKLVPDPNTLAIVQSIFEMKLQGMSAAGIAAALNDSGVLSPLAYKQKHDLPHPTGGFADNHHSKWSVATISRILQDETYTGTLVQGKKSCLNYKSRTILHLDEDEWIKVKNTHLSIVAKLDYDAVQRILAKDTRAAPLQSRVYIFSGLLICGHCGCNLVRKTVKYKEQKYTCYYCPTGKGNGCPSSLRVREKGLLDWATGEVRKRISMIAELAHTFSEDEFQKIMQRKYILQMTDYEEQIRRLCNFRSSLSGSIEAGLISTTEHDSLYRGYHEEITQLEAKIGALQQAIQFPEKKDELAWRQNFLRFSHITELDRAAVVRMIQSIRIFSKTEFVINFVYQSEYQRAVQYAEQGGDSSGQKKPETD